MKKTLACSLLLAAYGFSYAQEESSRYIHKGLLRAQATISPGIFLKNNVSTISIHGNLEYHIDNNISLRGDGFYFLKAKDYFGYFDSNHSIFAGASYHFKTKNHLDPYLAFEPGMSVTQSDYYYCLGFEQCEKLKSKVSANPLISSAAGFNYYFQRWFHLFVETRYIHGKHLSDSPISLSLNELRFSFGLGWNLWLMRKKKE